MPQIQNIILEPECSIILWQITEEIEELIHRTILTPEDQERLSNWGSSSRKKEFLISRLIVQSFLGQEVSITYNEEGRPLLQNSEWEISISHTKDLVGVILGRGFDIALDIEYISSRVEKIKKRFLSTEELKHISPDERLLHLYQHWCAKECLIKLFGKKDLHLTKELRIHPFNPNDNTYTGTVDRPPIHNKYLFHHKRRNNHLIVWCCQPKQQLVH